MLVLAVAVNFIAINVPFFTDDQGLYASIAKNMVLRRDFLQLFTYNQEWLDKPHFPFWMIAASFKLFGFSAWAYRLPALIFFLISLLYTYLFTLKYYNRETAFTAALILATALNVMLSNTDVRAEPYLMGLIMGAVYHISNLKDRFNIGDLLLTALFTACAIMTKGVFVIVAIYGSLFGQLLLSGKWKALLNFRWVFLILLTLIFTLPEIYALYSQFDLHPEKLVFGRHGISGIRWFLWDSQFGRFINNGPIVHKTSGSIFFYLHTLLWAFAPWCLIFYYAVFENIKRFYNKQKLKEYYAISGGLLLLLLFSLSRFQLPFYTNTVFPLFAIVAAPYLNKELGDFGNKLRGVVQWIFIILLPIAVVLLNIFLRPQYDWFFWVDCLLLLAAIAIVVIYCGVATRRLFFFSCTSALFAGFFLNTIFYNQVTPYRGEIAAANYINLKPFNRFPVYTLKSSNNIFQFYCSHQVTVLPLEQFKNFRAKEASLFYADQQSLQYLLKTHTTFKVIHSFITYPQENILPKFIYRNTRATVLDRVYLISK